MDLERELRALEIAWPETPALQMELLPRRRSRLLLAAVALGAAALAAALSVPQSRGAILRFLHLGGATIERVERLPAAQERPLAAGIGPVVPPSQLHRTLLLPPLEPPPPFHLRDGVVSLLFVYRGEPVLLSELESGTGIGFFKKLAAGGTGVEPLEVDGAPGLWLSGAAHVFVFPQAPPRLAGNVLIWLHGPLTLRLEGRELDKSAALALTETLR